MKQQQQQKRQEVSKGKARGYLRIISFIKKDVDDARWEIRNRGREQATVVGIVSAIRCKNCSSG
jgi:hypothetical protein